MSDAANYSDLIREAFIDPIRSVMIIDDQYPTWEEILDSGRWTQDKDGNLTSPVNPKSWWSDPSGPREVLRQFRQRDKGLMIDIHDGRPPEILTPDRIVSFLHQSDLLVLDYQLEGEAAGGDRARELAHHLLTQNHFNLIVVHTNKNELFDPFSEILLRLLTKCASNSEYDERVMKGEDAIDDIDDEKLADRLRAEFRISQYLAVRHPFLGAKSSRRLAKGETPFEDINTQLNKTDIDKSKYRDVLSWLVRDFENRISSAFGSSESDSLIWSDKADCLWIRTDRGFIAFANKKTSDLLKCLQDALEDWQPSPSRLLSAKFRHSIDEYGVMAEDKTLSKRHVYAKFYSDIKNADEQKSGALLDDHVVRQTERVTAEIQQSVRDFGLAIRRIDDNDKNNLKLSNHYGVDLEKEVEANKAIRHYNNYVSCRPVHGYHLTCGHIFELGGDKWVVVSPACDMVPGQKQMGFSSIHEEHRPFVALRLYKYTKTLDDNQINSGSYIFLETSDDVEVYRTFEMPEKGLEQAPKVTWSNFIALNKGVLGKGNSFEVLAIEATQKEIGSKTHSVKVIAQLRYEFALNLIHRLGTTMTRIGLSYVGSGKA